MSKRCELQKEYHREHGNYKGAGKYNDYYVKWLEGKILALNIQNVSISLECEDCDGDIGFDDVFCKHCGNIIDN